MDKGIQFFCHEFLLLYKYFNEYEWQNKTKSLLHVVDDFSTYERNGVTFFPALNVFFEVESI